MQLTCLFRPSFLNWFKCCYIYSDWARLGLHLFRQQSEFLKFFTKGITDKQRGFLEMAEIHYKRAHKNARLYPVHVTLTNPAKHCLDVFCFYWQYLVRMDHSKGNNNRSRLKGKHNGELIVGASVYISVNCFAVFESSTFTFVGSKTKQITLVAATSVVFRFAVSRATLKIENM